MATAKVTKVINKTKQRWEIVVTITLSSTEAEYMALSDCSRQAVWIQALLRELGYKIPIVPICGDNQGSIFIG